MGILKRIVLGASLAVLVAGTAFAEAPKGTASASVSVMSNYVWRGQKLSDGMVVQPSVGMTYGSFGANLWSNWDKKSGEANETDLTLNYATSIDKVGVEAGYIYYALEGLSDTAEVYVKLGYDTVLKPALTVYYDMVEGKGGFAILTLKQSIPAGKLSVDLGAYASANLGNKIMGDFNGLHNAEISVSTGIPVGPATITPLVAYTFPLSDKAKHALRNVSFDGDSSVVYGGVTVSLGF